MKEYTLRFRLIMIMVFVLVLLAACGPATPTETPEVEEPTATSPAAQPETETETNGEPASGPPEAFQDLDYTTTDSGLQIAVTEEGDGEQAAEGKVVSVHYTGMLADGTVFDSSLNRGEPIRFPLGQGRVIPGWDEGISMLSEGAMASLIIPPELGYGAQGSGGVIPPDATLYFQVELLDVLEGGPAEPEDVEASAYEETDSGLQYFELEEGDGEVPEEGQPVRIHYTAWLEEDGTRIDSSIDMGEPLSFELGSEQVFPGWNEAVALMDEGDLWQVIIPSELALGEQGAGDVIPPDSNLIMQIELVELLPPAPDAPSEVDEDEYTTTESGLQYADLEEGEGDEAQEGDAVTVHYTGWLEDGTRFDSSYTRGEPLPVVVGAGQVIPGWDEGLVGMKAGGRRQLVIPPDLAYGEQGAGGVIPPDATLIFEVEMESVGSGTTPE